MINFYEHDFSSLEIDRVVQVLKSSWVNTGPEAISFEKEVGEFLSIGKIKPKIILTSSAWASLFLALKVWGIKMGDEVITTPYTFSATANVILQNQAKVVFADVGRDYLIDPKEVEKKITPQTKAIIPMDYGGQPADYKTIHSLVRKKKSIFQASNSYQKKLGRILILGDGAHSFGTAPKQDDYALLPDIYAYSFHILKNLTTVDGGAVSVINKTLSKISSFFEVIRSLTLHGMTNNAYDRFKKTKLKKNNFYDIVNAGFKTNLTDIKAAIGRMQLKRMDEFLRKKKKILDFYNNYFSGSDFFSSKNIFLSKDYSIFPHLYTLEIKDPSFNTLDKKLSFINEIKKKGVVLNMHYLPLPLTQFYQKLGYTIKDFPVSSELSNCHFSIPFYTKLSMAKLKKIVKTLDAYFIS